MLITGGQTSTNPRFLQKAHQKELFVKGPKKSFLKKLGKKRFLKKSAPKNLIFLVLLEASSFFSAPSFWRAFLKSAGLKSFSRYGLESQ
jgi:hypothetical protein